MKPLTSPHAYSNLIKSTKALLLLLSGGIVLFILILLMQLFSYFSQPAINGYFPEEIKNISLLAVSPERVDSLSKIEDAVHKDSAETIKTSIKSLSTFKNKTNKLVVVHKSAKHSLLLNEDEAFLAENGIENSEIVKELAQVTEMHEFHFKHASFQLTKNTGMQKLDSSIQKYIATPESWSKIIILGFTDNRGTKLANIKLGMKRAETLKQILIKKGIPAEKISIASFGSDLPIGSNNNETGRALNRRVELNLVGTGS